MPVSHPTGSLQGQQVIKTLDVGDILVIPQYLQKLVIHEHIISMYFFHAIWYGKKITGH